MARGLRFELPDDFAHLRIKPPRYVDVVRENPLLAVLLVSCTVAAFTAGGGVALAHIADVPDMKAPTSRRALAAEHARIPHCSLCEQHYDPWRNKTACGGLPCLDACMCGECGSFECFHDPTSPCPVRRRDRRYPCEFT